MVSSQIQLGIETVFFFQRDYFQSYNVLITPGQLLKHLFQNKDHLSHVLWTESSVTKRLALRLALSRERYTKGCLEDVSLKLQFRICLELQFWTVSFCIVCSHNKPLIEYDTESKWVGNISTHWKLSPLRTVRSLPTHGRFQRQNGDSELTHFKQWNHKDTAILLPKTLQYVYRK